MRLSAWVASALSKASAPSLRRSIPPSLPMIDPLQESYLAWLMKVRMLKPAYVSVLKGRV